MTGGGPGGSQMTRRRTFSKALALVAMTGLFGASTTAFAARSSIEVGGGVTDYNRALAGQTDPGVAWGANINLMATPIFGVELGYLGSRVNYDPTLGPSGLIHQNGGSARLRLNMATGQVRPFAFGGIGGSRLTTGDAVPLDSQTVLDLPVGAGLEVGFGDVFIVSARGIYNFMLDTDFPTGPAGAVIEDNAFDRWNVMLNIGARM